MSTYDKIAWLPLCGGLTGLGLVLSYIAMRRRGLGAGLRGAAWSLLPLAAYLTGAIEMFWKMGAAIGDFAKGFVFSAQVWAGIAVAGLAVVLFVVSGPLRRGGARTSARTTGRRHQDRRGGARPGAQHPDRSRGCHGTAPRRKPRRRPRRARAGPRPRMTTTSEMSRTSCAVTASPRNLPAIFAGYRRNLWRPVHQA